MVNGAMVRKELLLTDFRGTNAIFILLSIVVYFPHFMHFIYLVLLTIHLQLMQSLVLQPTKIQEIIQIPYPSITTKEIIE